MKAVLQIITVWLGVSFIMSLSVSAYLDPSVITYAIQIVAGIVITCGAALTIYRKKIMLFIKKQMKKSK